MGREYPLALLGILLCAGCGVSLSPIRNAHEFENARAHSVFVDGDGHALHPSPTADAETIQPDSAGRAEYGAWIHGILEELRKSGRHDILIRIHGGMNTLDEQVSDTTLTKRILEESSFYPIYINWESSITRSYLDHLFFVRQGQAYRGWDLRGWGLAPVYLAGDAGRAVTRAPIVWGVQTANFFGRSRAELNPWSSERSSELAVSSARRAQSDLFPGSQLRPCDDGPHPVTTTRPPIVEYGPDCRSAWLKALDITAGAVATIGVMPYSRNFVRYKHNNSIGRFSLQLPSHFLWPSVRLFSPWMVRNIAWIPFRPLTSAVIDAAGVPGYANMRRRTRTMVREANDFTPAKDRIAPSDDMLRYRQATGAIAQLMDSIQALTGPGVASEQWRPPTCAWSSSAHHTATARRIRDSSQAMAAGGVAPERYTVTLVGHSMGTIVATEIVAGCPGIPFRNIVFMAAAATAREFELGVLPYLRTDTSARFFNLTLNPAAERNEWPHGLFVSTQGSLLEWLDAFLYTPETDADRVFGRYENAVSSIHILPDSVRSRLFFKSFSYTTRFGNKGLPYRHGDFSGRPFWQCTFWMPTAAVTLCQPTPVVTTGASNSR